MRWHRPFDARGAFHCAEHGCDQFVYAWNDAYVVTALNMKFSYPRLDHLSSDFNAGLSVFRYVAHYVEPRL